MKIIHNLDKRNFMKLTNKMFLKRKKGEPRIKLNWVKADSQGIIVKS